MHTANADTDEESPGSEHGEHALSLALEVRAGSEGSEENEDDGRCYEGIVAGPAIREVAEEELADDSAGESDTRDILGSGRSGVQSTVLKGKNGVDGTDNLFIWC